MTAPTSPAQLPAVCGVCHTRVTRLRPSGIWIHARAPKRWHPAEPTTRAKD